MTAWFRIEGAVQNVGFRAFVRRVAERLELDGEVWNVADGAVEAVASGSAEALDRFAAALRDGPGRVESIRREGTEVAVPAGFRVGLSR